MTATPIVFRKEMGVTHVEIHRLMPRVAQGVEFHFADGCFTLPLTQGRVEIHISPQGERRLSAIAVFPLVHVEIHCHAMNDAQAHDFVRHFDKQFFRAGG